MDERNLCFCDYLSVKESSITTIDTTYLKLLRVLVLSGTDVSFINTEPLINL